MSELGVALKNFQNNFVDFVKKIFSSNYDVLIASDGQKAIDIMDKLTAVFSNHNIFH